VTTSARNLVHPGLGEGEVLRKCTGICGYLGRTAEDRRLSEATQMEHGSTNVQEGKRSV